MNPNCFTRVRIYTYSNTSKESDRQPYTSLDTNPKKVKVTEGEDLPHIAYREYGDSKLWYLLADANNLINPFDITVGQVLDIPKLSKFQ